MRFLEKLKKKHYILCGLAILLTGVIVYLFCPLYLSAEQKLNMQNDTARIDIYNYGSKENAIKILSDTKYSEPSWCKKDNGNCSVITENISRKWRKYNIKFKVIGDGNIQIRLRGPDRRNAENKRYKILVDYRSFTVNNKKIFKDAKSVWHDNPFQYHFKAKNGDIILLNIKARRHFINFKTFDKLIFLSVLILAFLFSYKLVHYVSKFKIIENNSRIDIVFVVVFALLLFVPMSHISDAQKSVQENRMLAKYPVFFANNGINSKYGTQFESWFNDRFWGRDTIINFYNKTKYNLTSEYYIANKTCINKKTKWLGSCGYKRKLFSTNQLRKASRSIKKLINFTNKNNIKVYFLIAPSQGSIYGKNIFPWYINDNEHEQIYQMANYLKKNNGVNIIYPYQDILKASKNEFMFFKTDTHWTDTAAFIAYKNVMKEVKNYLRDIKISSDNDFDYVFSNKVKVLQKDGFHNGRNYRISGLDDDRFFDVTYKYYMHKDRNNLDLEIISHPEDNYVIRHFFYNKGKYNLTLFGDSFGENLEPIIPYSFKKTIRIYTYIPSLDLLPKNANIQRFENDILKNNTDVLIICFSMIDRLIYLYKD